MAFFISEEGGILRMSDFSANIKAVLDTSGIPKQITEIQNQLNKIGSIKITLGDGKNTLNVTALNNEIKNSLSKTGTNAGQAFAQSLNSSLNNIHLRNGGLGNIKNMLQGAGFNSKSIDIATQSLDKMVVSVAKLNTTQLKNGNIRIKINGIDEVGRAVNIVRDFDKETGRVVNTTKSFSQSFKLVSDSVKNTLSNNIQAWMNKNGESASQFRNELESLQKQLKGNVTSDSYSNIANRFKEITSEVAASKAGIKNYKSELADIKLKIDIGTFKSQIDSIESAFKKIGIDENALSANDNLTDGQKAQKRVVDNTNRLKNAYATMTSSSASPEQKVDAYKEFNTVLATTRSQLSSVVKAKSEFAKHSKEVEQAEATLTKSKTLSNNIQTWMNQNTKAADRFGEELKELQQQLNNNSDPLTLKNVKLKFAEIKSEAKALGLTTNTFLTNLKNIGAQLLGLTSTVAIIQKAIEIAEKMYQNVYEIDTAMTNLKKVTDESDTAYSKFFSRTADSAKNLGKTISGLITQTSEWAKLGYSLTESEELSKLSSIYANVGEVDDETAVSDMVTALKAYNIDTDDAVKIVDIYNELGNKFAISSAKLGEGISRSASALNLAGASIEQSSAMLTGIAEITQNAPEAGNSLKIFTMRIRGMKGELEELGEEVDPTVDSISKVQTQILNLTKGKVNIFDSTGSFRNYYDIMKEIADIYDELSSTDKASLLEILFGKQRGNAGSALIQAFQSGQVEKALEAANNSAGSAMAEQEKWMESLEAKTSQLKAAWEELSSVVLDSDFLKKVVDSGTSLLSVLSKIIDNVGVLNTALAGAAIYKTIKSIS